MATIDEIAVWFDAEDSRLHDSVRGSAHSPVRQSPVQQSSAQQIQRVSSIEQADLDSLVFATDTATLERALASKAGVVLAPRKLMEASHARDNRVLWVLNPRLAFARAGQRLQKGSDDTGVHPTAVLGEGVVLGANVSIGPGAVIGDGVQIGSGSHLHARVVVYAGTTIGERVTVQAGAVLGATGFGYVRDEATGQYLRFPQQGTLAIEDDVEIGANTTIDRGALEETRIGAGSKLDNLVHIGHNCRIGKNVIIAAQTGISGSSVVEDGAILGGQVGIGEHALVGAGVILGGGAGVLSGKKLRGANEVFWGRPAQPLKQYLRDLAKLRKPS